MIFFTFSALFALFVIVSSFSSSFVGKSDDILLIMYLYIIAPTANEEIEIIIYPFSAISLYDIVSCCIPNVNNANRCIIADDADA